MHQNAYQLAMCRQLLHYNVSHSSDDILGGGMGGEMRRILKITSNNTDGAEMNDKHR
jgi:hypothetical protein